MINPNFNVNLAQSSSEATLCITKNALRLNISANTHWEVLQSPRVRHHNFEHQPRQLEVEAKPIFKVIKISQYNKKEDKELTSPIIK